MTQLRDQSRIAKVFVYFMHTTQYVSETSIPFIRHSMCVDKSDLDQLLTASLEWYKCATISLS